jgi:hypothetical protein
VDSLYASRLPRCSTLSVPGARKSVGREVAAILMPVADRALNALYRVQQGFFIQQQRGDEQVSFRLPDGTWEKRSAERATAMLLRVTATPPMDLVIQRDRNGEMRSTPASSCSIMVNCRPTSFTFPISACSTLSAIPADYGKT